MTLQALLDYLRENRLRDTARDVESGDDPRLWSDETLVTNLNEACQEFAKRTLCLRTTRSFTTVAYQKAYPIDDTIIAVQSAEFLGNGSWVNGAYVLNAGLDPAAVLVYPDQANLGRTGHAQLETYSPPDRAFFDVNQMTSLPPGKPYVYDLDEMIGEVSGVSGTTSVRLYPICSPKYANCLVTMRCITLPAELTLETLDDEPEIPREYHRKLVDYAAALALDITDGEMGDPDRAASYMTTFKDNCEIARREILRKTFTPLTWGFGHNAFSYVSN